MSRPPDAGPPAEPSGTGPPAEPAGTGPPAEPAGTGPPAEPAGTGPPADAPWRSHGADRIIGRGHTAGDFLEAYDWEVLEERAGHLRLGVHVPDHVRNPRGQLFGGFTPTYVDLVALFTFRAGDRAGPWRGWLATLRMEVEYLEPVTEDHVEIVSEITARRGRNVWVHTRFLGPEGQPLVLATTVLRNSQ